LPKRRPSPSKAVVAYDLFRIERGAMREDMQDASAPQRPGPHRRGSRPGWLPEQGNARLTALLGGAGAVTLLALLGLATGDPFVYPPLGASAFLIFSMPELPSAAPRNAIGGQVCGVAGGAVALAAFGLLHHHAGVADMSGARAGAIGVSLLLATALMLLFKVAHPAAGATALMISLGIVTSPSQWLELLGAVVLLCAMGVVVNRWAGITYPLWSPPVPVS
jgi:CBS domain-containing membrane protein